MGCKRELMGGWCLAGVVAAVVALAGPWGASVAGVSAAQIPADRTHGARESEEALPPSKYIGTRCINTSLRDCFVLSSNRARRV